MKKSDCIVGIKFGKEILDVIDKRKMLDKDKEGFKKLELSMLKNGACKHLFKCRDPKKTYCQNDPQWIDSYWMNAEHVGERKRHAQYKDYDSKDTGLRIVLNDDDMGQHHFRSIEEFEKDMRLLTKEEQQDLYKYKTRSWEEIARRDSFWGCCARAERAIKEGAVGTLISIACGGRDGNSNAELHAQDMCKEELSRLAKIGAKVSRRGR